jgi:SAM-dependent methyltransferase
MANFIPFKAYILRILDEFIKMYDINGPFLDGGCGKGDVALHLAKKGWQGTAIDNSLKAVEVSKELLHPFPQVTVNHASIQDDQERKFGLILLLDVIEHILDDTAVISAAAKMGNPGTYLMITVPSNPEREWRWDDDFYGHLRRYKPKEMHSLLEKYGYKIVEMWDISFPFFWLLRRGFTELKQPPDIEDKHLHRTEKSPFINAWEMGRISDFLSNPYFWKPVFMVQNKFRNHLDKGNELAVLAKRI